MKKIIMSIMCIMLLLSMVLYLGKLVRPVETDDDIMAINTFHELPEGSVDVIVYGSSHAWKGLNTMKMYEDYGIGAYNYGTNWEKINTTKLFLKDSFRTQSPKVVLIETGLVETLKEDVDMDGEIYYTKAIPYSTEKREYLAQCFKGDIGRYISYYLPLVAFHENRENITEFSFREGLKWYYDFKSTMGFRGSDAITEVDIPDWSVFAQAELPDSSRDVLDDMVEACQKNNIELIFYTAPYMGEFNYSKALEQYAYEKGCIYIDFFKLIEEVGIDGKTDFQDAGHLNTNGANKLADYLGKYISDNYDLEDKRLLENNIWENGF